MQFSCSAFGLFSFSTLFFLSLSPFSIYEPPFLARQKSLPCSALSIAGCGTTWHGPLPHCPTPHKAEGKQTTQRAAQKWKSPWHFKWNFSIANCEGCFIIGNFIDNVIFRRKYDRDDLINGNRYFSTCHPDRPTASSAVFHDAHTVFQLKFFLAKDGS